MADNCEVIAGLEREWRDALCGKDMARLGSLMHRRDKPVPAAGEGFNKSRVVRRIAQRIPQLLYRHIQATVKIDEAAIRPKGRTQPVATHYFSGMFQ